MKKAFTLSELLIAISIIGLILILTIPPVVDNMINKNHVSGLQRVYLLLSDAVKVMMQEERSVNVEKTYLYMSSDEDVDSSAGAFIKKFFKTSLDCGTKARPCFASSYKSLDGSAAVTLPSDGDSYCVSLASRASMCIVPPQNNELGKVFVDVNGIANPNVAGRDLFLFYIYSDGFVGDRDSDIDICASSTDAAGCFRKLVKSNWVMDY